MRPASQAQAGTARTAASGSTRARRVVLLTDAGLAEPRSELRGLARARLDADVCGGDRDRRRDRLLDGRATGGLFQGRRVAVGGASEVVLDADELAARFPHRGTQLRVADEPLEPGREHA